MTATEAEQKIRFVVTMFRLIGWPFAILLVPAALLTSPLMIYRAFTDSEISVGIGLLLALIIILYAAVPVGMLWIAKRLLRGGPSAKGAAIFISIVLLLVAFPISTFVGVFFLSRISNYYDDYCRQYVPSH